jgi:hypothetical protein
MKMFRTIWYTILILAVLIGLILRHEARKARHHHDNGPKSKIRSYVANSGRCQIFSFDPITTRGWRT